MAITVASCLELPSLAEAVVIAGATGLDRPVRAVTVLESANASEYLTPEIVLGDEIVITAFIASPLDVEKQCDIIRILHAGGESALILFYVGIFMPSISQRIIDVADELGFPIICMPKNRVDIPYSEVIREIMELIFRRMLRANAWHGDPERETEAEFVQVVLDDDRLGYHRLVRKLNLGKLELKGMRVILLEEDHIGNEKGKQLLSVVRNHYLGQGIRVFAAVYEGSLVVLFPAARKKCGAKDDEKLLGLIQDSVLVARLEGFIDLNDIRETYGLSRRALVAASRIFNRKKVFTRHDLGFADNVLRIISTGNEAIQPYLAHLSPLRDYDAKCNTELYMTLETLLLDANMSTAITANLLYLHQHTIQYRIRKIKEILHDDVFDFSAQFELATSLAIGRLLIGDEKCP